MEYEHEHHERRDKRPRVGARMPNENPQLHGMMATYLESRDLDLETARKAGWYPSSSAGDEHPRIVMPATNTQGLCYWQARAMNKDVEPRYQSPSVPRGDSLIVVYPIAKMYIPCIILCEGPMDALAAAGGGILGIALMGKNPTSEVFMVLQTYLADVEHATFFADRDAIESAVEIVQQFMRTGQFVSISSPSPYKDLAAIPKKRRQEILDMYLTRCMK